MARPSNGDTHTRQPRILACVPGRGQRPNGQRAGQSADGESGQIVVTALVHTRHFGRFTANQRAAGLTASLGYAGNYVAGGGDVEASGRHVVQEKQWFCALYDQIVDAHGDEIGADGFVLAGFDGNPQLGADAIGCGNQQGVPKSDLLEIEQAAKPAKGRVRVELQLRGGAVSLEAQVLTTNVPGNIQKANMPMGMGVEFLDVPEEARHALAEQVEAMAERFRIDKQDAS